MRGRISSPPPKGSAEGLCPSNYGCRGHPAGGSKGVSPLAGLQIFSPFSLQGEGGQGDEVETPAGAVGVSPASQNLSRAGGWERKPLRKPNRRCRVPPYIAPARGSGEGALPPQLWVQGTPCLPPPPCREHTCYGTLPFAAPHRRSAVAPSVAHRGAGGGGTPSRSAGYGGALGGIERPAGEGRKGRRTGQENSEGWPLLPLHGERVLHQPRVSAHPPTD